MLGQAMVVSAHASMMLGASNPDVRVVVSDCHGDSNHMDSNAASPQSVQVSDSCCDGDCSMMGCHATSALLNTVTLPNLMRSSHLAQVAVNQAPLNRNSSLYRPPILG
jgi:hypothetical protein